MGITYSKLFNTLPDSTIWAEPNPTRICWITMLAMADQFGRVYSSIPGLANRARISLDETEVALATIEARSPYDDSPYASRTADGWQMLRWEFLYCERSDRPPGDVWAEIRNRIFARDEYSCRYCGAIGGRLECDHVVPVCQGGDHCDDNLVTACFSCNRSKGGRLIADWKGVVAK